MSKETMTEEAASMLKAVLRDAPHGGSSIASAAALGIAGGAGAVYALEHHGRVKTERAARRKG